MSSFPLPITNYYFQFVNDGSSPNANAHIMVTEPAGDKPGQDTSLLGFYAQLAPVSGGGPVKTVSFSNLSSDRDVIFGGLDWSSKGIAHSCPSHLRATGGTATLS